MSDYTMAQAKADFSRGLIFEAKIYAPLDLDRGYGAGWTVYLNGGQWGGGMLVDARDRNVRTFKTVDSAVRAIRSIGFPALTLSVS